MKHFDETADYWGDSFEKIILQNRLTVRSVKVFADGELSSTTIAPFLCVALTDNSRCRRPPLGRSSSALRPLSPSTLR